MYTKETGYGFCHGVVSEMKRNEIPETIFVPPTESRAEYIMKISEAEVRYVAQLARLNLDEERIPKMAETLSEILTYIDTLNELDTTDVPPTSYIETIETVLRNDEVGPSLSRDEALQNAPDRVGAFFRVPKIIE